MRLMIFFMFIGCMQLSASSYSQTITLKVKEARPEAVMKIIQKQTGYLFFYDPQDMKDAPLVTVNLHNETLENVLNRCFKENGYNFSIVKKTIFLNRQPIKQKNAQLIQAPPTAQEITIRGRVTDTLGNALAGVNVMEKGSSNGTTTDKNGRFTLTNAGEGSFVLVFSYVGYETKEVTISNQQDIRVMLNYSNNQLDALQIIAYGTTTKRFNTGSVTTVSAKDIENQPVTNPLAALAGRVPGMVVTQSSGVPGASYKIQIRGINSIAQGSEPFFIIDGVPFAPNNKNLEQVAGPFTFSLGNNTGGLSPFNTINPADIESIEVLKDADATAIYGSRGANGVVLITTKKGKAGKTKIDANIQTGASRVTRTMPMLNTQQYVYMRKKAFENDGVAMTNANAYDILVWDTTRYTNWAKQMVGGTANRTNSQLSVSGGTASTQFLIAGNYTKETTVYPGDMSYKRGGLHFNISNTSVNRRFKAMLTGSYSSDANNIIPSDLAEAITYLPNLPNSFDENGKLKWSEGGYLHQNPYASLVRKYRVSTDNLIGNLLLDYKIAENLYAKLNSGYNSIRVDELSTLPIYAQNPANNPTGTATFANNSIKSLIVEPQLNYNKSIGKNKLNVLIGGTWQLNKTNGMSIRATGFTNDDLLESVAAATAYSATPNISEYKYAAVFGKINYNHSNTYLLNITARRDGSSRFGPGRQYANFGAVGAGWIFSNLPDIEQSKVLSFGKIRASYGITGNDAIGDYKYLDTYSSTQYPYDGIAGLYPVQLFNEDYGWEVNKKLEVGLELGFFDDKLYINSSWYRNRSSNQLINYILPAQTGFSGITENLDALVQNTGLEIEVNGKIINSKNFSWSSSFNITIPKNKLLAFPDLEMSSYRNSYAIGKSLNIGSGFRAAGVDPATGVYQFYTSAGEITFTPSYPDDRVVGLVNLDPKFYGGFRNDFGYKQLTLGVLVDFRKQMGNSSSHHFNTLVGNRVNQSAVFADVWENPGDLSQNQKYSTSSAASAYKAWQTILSYQADLMYTDASFIRVKNISLSYDFSKGIIEKIKLSNLRVYVEGHNLLLFTNYYGTDPETQLIGRTPPLKTLVCGVQLSL